MNTTLSAGLSMALLTGCYHVDLYLDPARMIAGRVPDSRTETVELPRSGPTPPNVWGLGNRGNLRVTDNGGDPAQGEVLMTRTARDSHTAWYTAARNLELYRRLAPNRIVIDGLWVNLSPRSIWAGIARIAMHDYGPLSAEEVDQLIDTSALSIAYSFPEWMGAAATYSLENRSVSLLAGSPFEGASRQETESYLAERIFDLCSGGHGTPVIVEASPVTDLSEEFAALRFRPHVVSAEYFYSASDPFQ